ncbi:MAG: type II secretion system ATPase GspE [Candidatus Aureabacteria bacterium]|nr:type II secretion system ATPase GspE [Candidatus Auribacterota bacterium]
MSVNKDIFLKKMLINNNILSKIDIEDAYAEAESSGKRFRDVILQRGLLTEEQLISLLSKLLGINIVDLKNTQIDENVIQRISGSMVKMYNIFPVNLEHDTLKIAVADPFDSNLLDDLRFILETPVEICIAREKDIEEAIDKYYGKEGTDLETLMKELQTFSTKEDLEDVDIHEIEEMVNDAPVVRLLNLVLIQAIKDTASDIHFEPFEKEFKIRYRVDGVLYEMVPPPKHLSLAIISRIKVMARMNIAERRLPQDGRISINVEGRIVDLRVSTLPTAFGESVVLRVLDRSTVSLDLHQLGMSKDILKAIEDIIVKPNGIFISTGPTGAGKTTTLYSCLKWINTIDSKIITTEDPVEYDIEGIIQVPINERIGLTFARCLRSILRQDPDRIMVGEIRDVETARMAIQSSLTGHLVLSTLHTNDSSGALTRMVDMGVEPFLICSTVEAILAQRLVRKICADCKQEVEPSSEMIDLMKIDKKIIKQRKFFAGAGCEKCGGIGYRGRTGIYELLVVDEEIRRLIMEKSTAKMIKNAAKNRGLTTLLEDGLNKVFAGITTVEEVARCSMEE